MANLPSVSWSELTPAGSDARSAGDNRIRELKTQIREVIAVDHEFASSGVSATAGQHKQVTLQESADIGSGATGYPILGAQTVAGAPELMYTTEADVDIQITNTTGLNAPALTGVYPAANVAALATMMNLIYPVGIIVELGVSTNPATLFGVGTWTALEGTVVVGKAAAGTFGTLNATGGAETVDASHTHTLTTGTGSTNQGADDNSGGTDGTFSLSSHTHTATTASGGSATQSTLQPYIVKYVWQRSA